MLKVMVPLVIAGVLSAGAASANDSAPFRKNGIANCSLPWTTAEFHLQGDGRARLVKASSNYSGFNSAARVRTWSVGTVNMPNGRILVLDNGQDSRIMVKMPNGNGMAYLADGGVSDIICQVLVSP